MSETTPEQFASDIKYGREPGSSDELCGGKVGSSLTLVFRSNQFVQAIGNASSIVGLGLLSLLHCVELLRALSVFHICHQFP
jgi:hypothetical protein